MDTQFATSVDGTRIAYAAAGAGPPLVIVEGALGHRRLGAAKALSKTLTNHLTLYAYDRRGRGESEPGRSVYERQREVEDLGAVIAAAGGTAAVLGHSSGGALALEAARQGVEMTKLIIYEAPFVLDGSHQPTDPDLAEKLRSIVDEGRRSDTVKRFLKVAGVPAPIVAAMRLAPSWQQRTAVAHTLPYDVSIVIGFRQGKPLPDGYYEAVKPETLVIAGGKSPPYMRHAQEEIVQQLPHGSLEILAGERHTIRPRATTPALLRFVTKMSETASDRQQDEPSESYEHRSAGVVDPGCCALQALRDSPAAGHPDVEGRTCSQTKTGRL